MLQLRTVLFALLVSATAIAQTAGDGSAPVVEKSKSEILKDLKVKADNGDDPNNPQARFQGLLKPGEKDPLPAVPPAGKIPANLIKLGTGAFYSPYAFVFNKATRTLSIWHHQSNGGIQFVSAYPADMGKRAGEKERLGDAKTPEGIYFFQDKLEGNYLNFNEYGLRAFPLNYPNFFDRLAHRTGSGIWLHSISPKKSLRRGSRGCLVVRNDVIMTVSDYIEIYKTPIIVQHKVKWISAQKDQEIQHTVLTWLEQWRQAWQNKQIDKYIGFYDPQFRANHMNVRQWKRYKKSLNQKYKYISVKISHPIIYKHDNEWVVRFLQAYQSDHLSDFGEKFLYLKEESPGQLKILGEMWKGVSHDLIAQLFKKPAPFNK